MSGGKHLNCCAVICGSFMMLGLSGRHVQERKDLQTIFCSWLISLGVHICATAALDQVNAARSPWGLCVHRTLDAALVSPGMPTPFPNVRHMPDLSEGMSFNLANNIWGTNYIMWQPYGGQGANMRFRFEISSEQSSVQRAASTDVPEAHIAAS